jgi:glycosyltransferase involved in cell wall biosynthesis
MKADATVVVPTGDRPATLRRVVGARASQRTDQISPELVLVLNGTPAATRAEIERLAAAHPWPVQIVERPAASVAAARNAGIAAARSELLVLINDDIVPQGNGWLAGHVAAHRGAGTERLAVLGPVVWAPELGETRAMRWMAAGGHMNNYAGLEDGSNPGAFYASNLSIARSLIDEAGGFDERLGGYGWEEYDLSLRLHDRGLRVRLVRELVVGHLHRYELADSLARMEAIGRATVVFNRLHAHRDGLKSPHPSRWKVALGRATAPVATRIPIPDALPDRLAGPMLWYAHQAALARGYAEQERAS